MSRVFRDKNKDLIKLEVKTADEVWDLQNTRKGKPTIRKDIEVFGRIDKGTSAIITNTNMVGENHKYVEDTCNLPKNLKNQIANILKNKNRKVVYLVKRK